MIIAHITPLGLGVFIALGLFSAAVRDARRELRRRRADMAERREQWEAYRARGYHVIDRPRRYGPLVLDTPWNRSLAQLEQTGERLNQGACS